MNIFSRNIWNKFLIKTRISKCWYYIFKKLIFFGIGFFSPIHLNRITEKTLYSMINEMKKFHTPFIFQNIFIGGEQDCNFLCSFCSNWRYCWCLRCWGRCPYMFICHFFISFVCLQKDCKINVKPTIIWNYFQI